MKLDAKEAKSVLKRVEDIAFRAFSEGFIRAGGHPPSMIDQKIKEAWQESHIKGAIDDANPFKE